MTSDCWKMTLCCGSTPHARYEATVSRMFCRSTEASRGTVMVCRSEQQQNSMSTRVQATHLPFLPLPSHFFPQPILVSLSFPPSEERDGVRTNGSVKNLGSWVVLESNPLSSCANVVAQGWNASALHTRQHNVLLHRRMPILNGKRTHAINKATHTHTHTHTYTYTHTHTNHAQPERVCHGYEQS